MLALTLMLTLFTAIPTSAADGTWSEALVKKLMLEHPLSAGQVYVGYGIRSIMPTDSNMQLPLGGYGNTQNRIGATATKTTDTNYKYQRELFSTVVAVMDGNGEIVLFNTNDLVGLSSARRDAIRKEVSNATGIPENHINISSTHTHSGPDTGNNNALVRGAVQKYNLMMQQRVAEAAVDAVMDLYPASMSIDTVAVEKSDGTNELNFIRHYDTNVKDYLGDPILKADNHGAWYYDTATNTWKETTASNYKTNNGYNGHTTEADAELQMLKFDRGDNQNVLMCNFQSHPHRQGGSDSTVISADVIGAFRNYMTGQDGVQAAGVNNRAVPFCGEKIETSGSAANWQTKFDSTLTKSYRLAYYTGAAGNINPSSSVSNEGIKNLTSNDQGKFRASSLWGKILASYALKSFKGTDGQGFKPVNGGDIKVKSLVYDAPYPEQEQDDMYFTARCMNLLWGATDYNLKRMILGTYPYSDAEKEYFQCVTSEKGNVKGSVEAFTERLQTLILEDSTLKTKYNSGKTTFADSSVETGVAQTYLNRLVVKFGAYAQSKDGVSDIVESPYHASKIISWNTNKGLKHDVELTAVSIGDVSFASFPGELFDTNGMFIKQNSPYAMTFILGYSNGSQGYIASAYAYLYTTYETTNTIACPGTAELYAGVQCDQITDLLFEGNTYNMSVGESKALEGKDGKKLYSYVDSFDYEKHGSRYQNNTIQNTDIKGTDIKEFSYSSSVKWVSSDTSVATVDQSGNIKAVGKGVATISAMRTGGSEYYPNYYSHVASCSVVVGDHTHCDICGNDTCVIGSHEKQTYTAWTKTTSLPTVAGNYYLENDVTLSAAQTLNSDVRLCLNGHKVNVNSAGGAYGIANNAVLTVYDCKGTGIIAAKEGLEISDTKGVITVNGGTLNLAKGSISAYKTTSLYGNAIYITSGTVNIKGGSVLGGTAINAGGAIYNAGTLNITGGAISTEGAVNGGAISNAAGSIFKMSGGTVSGGNATLGGTISQNGKEAVLSGGTIIGGTVTESGGAIYLAKSCTFTMNSGKILSGVAKNGGNITVAGGAVFNMNGGEIVRGSTIKYEKSAYGGNVYVHSSATFNLNNGSICDGVSYGMGGNMAVSSGGKFNMKNGTLSQGASYVDANGSGGHGGNVFSSGTSNISGGIIEGGVANACGGGNFSINGGGSRVTITGGTIKNGSAKGTKLNGNIFVWNTAGANAFTMTGGTVTDDSSFYRMKGFAGGGVYLAYKEGYDSTLNISGTARIINNIGSYSINKDDLKVTKNYCNIYLEEGKTINLTGLTTGKVGVTMATPGEFAIGSARYKDFVTSDNTLLYVVRSGKNLENLALGTEEDTGSVEYSREGVPSNIEYVDHTSDNPAFMKDGYEHFNLATSSDTVDFSTVFSGVTSVATDKMSYTQKSGFVVSYKTAGGCDIYQVTHNGTVTDCVVATGHYHCVECGTYGCLIHKNVNYNPITNLSEAKTSGNYYLSEDIETSSAGASLSKIDGKLNICFNGKKVTSNTYRFLSLTKNNSTTSTNSVVNVSDCSSEGTGEFKYVNRSWTDHAWLNNCVDETSTVNIYGGTFDGSNSSCAYSSVNTNGTFNLYKGTIITGKTNDGKNTTGVRVSGGGKFNMYGGTIDSFKSVATYGTTMRVEKSSFATIYAGKIICGTTSAATNSSTGGGNISVSGTLNMYGGIIQDGTTQCSATETRSCGNIYIINGAVFNMYGGIVANGVCYGIGGNISMGSGATMNMSGGLITGGKAYPKGGLSGDGHGGNIFASGKVNISGGVITEGRAYGHGGGNLSINSTGSSVTMTGGTISNGACSSDYPEAGNVFVWYQAGTNKVAFTMTGGTITDTEDFDLPYGMGAGGLRTYFITNNVKLGGTAKIYGNRGCNLSIGDGNTILIGEFSEGANIQVTFKEEGLISENCGCNPLPYIHADEYSQNATFLFDESNSSLSVYLLSDSEIQFLNNFFSDGENYYTELNDNNLKQISSAKNLWEVMTAERKLVVNAFFKSKGATMSIDEMFEHLADFSTEGKADRFINENLYADGELVKSATLENIAVFEGFELKWNALDSDVKAAVNSKLLAQGADSVEKMLSDNEANKHTLEVYANAEEFINNNLYVEGELIKTATLGNTAFFDELGAKWDELDSEVKSAVDVKLTSLGADTLTKMMSQSQEYKHVLDFKVVEKGGVLTFYSTVDNLDDYAYAGFIIELERGAYGILKTNCVVSAENSEVTGICGTPDTWSQMSNYIFYSAPYDICERDMGTYAKVYSFVELYDGTYILGNSQIIKLPEKKQTNLVVVENGIVNSGESDFDGSDFDF